MQKQVDQGVTLYSTTTVNLMSTLAWVFVKLEEYKNSGLQEEWRCYCNNTGAKQRDQLGENIL